MPKVPKFCPGCGSNKTYLRKDKRGYYCNFCGYAVDNSQKSPFGIGGIF